MARRGAHVRRKSYGGGRGGGGDSTVAATRRTCVARGIGNVALDAALTSGVEGAVGRT